jgi:hypothetical protein
MQASRSSVAAFGFTALFGLRYLPVPALTLALWGFTAGVLYYEGSRRLRQLMAIV